MSIILPFQKNYINIPAITINNNLLLNIFRNAPSKKLLLCTGGWNLVFFYFMYSSEKINLLWTILENW